MTDGSDNKMKEDDVMATMNMITEETHNNDCDKRWWWQHSE